MKKLLSIVCALAVLATMAACAPKSNPAPAQEGSTNGTWEPEKKINFVIPYEAGGNTDIPARVFAKYMSKYSAQEVEITNQPGSGGRAGAKKVMNAKADGYTVLLQPSAYPMQSALGIADFTYLDFAPIGYWLDSSMVVVVNAKSDYKTMDDLINAAKASPDTIKMGSVTGTLPLFGVLAIEEQKGVTFNKVDLSGASKSPELLGNRIDGYIDGFGSVKQFVDSGDFRCLGVIDTRKIEGYPDIPTFDELGFTNFSYLKQDFGMWAPKGTPPEAISYINNLIKQASEDEECIAELAAMNYMPKHTTTEEYVAVMEEIYTEFQEAAKSVV